MKFQSFFSSVLIQVQVLPGDKQDLGCSFACSQIREQVWVAYYCAASPAHIVNMGLYLSPTAIHCCFLFWVHIKWLQIIVGEKWEKHTKAVFRLAEKCLRFMKTERHTLTTCFHVNRSCLIDFIQITHKSLFYWKIKTTYMKITIGIRGGSRIFLHRGREYHFGLTSTKRS